MCCPLSAAYTFSNLGHLSHNLGLLTPNCSPACQPDHLLQLPPMPAWLPLTASPTSLVTPNCPSLLAWFTLTAIPYQPGHPQLPPPTALVAPNCPPFWPGCFSLLPPANLVAPDFPPPCPGQS
uniref:Uncharacterized protein n=1 Tax=Pipistrellus kuhlii TaxID=59472 RepID=A0A7J8A856_PIPKU|nr:hypothetical protein mPipKuh1_008890 [Pipistrellus kuhlii]